MLRPALDPLQHIHVLLMLGAPELDAVLQVGSQESRVKGQNHLPQPAGHASLDAARLWLAFWAASARGQPMLSCSSTSTPQVLLLRATWATLRPACTCVWDWHNPRAEPCTSPCWTSCGSHRPTSPACQGPSEWYPFPPACQPHHTACCCIFQFQEAAVSLGDCCYSPFLSLFSMFFSWLIFVVLLQFPCFLNVSHFKSLVVFLSCAVLRIRLFALSLLSPFPTLTGISLPKKSCEAC